VQTKSVLCKAKNNEKCAKMFHVKQKNTSVTHIMFHVKQKAKESGQKPPKANIYGAKRGEMFHVKQKNKPITCKNVPRGTKLRAFLQKYRIFMHF
jgi:hypothetical protein